MMQVASGAWELAGEILTLRSTVGLVTSGLESDDLGPL